MDFCGLFGGLHKYGINNNKKWFVRIVCLQLINVIKNEMSVYSAGFALLIP